MNKLVGVAATLGLMMVPAKAQVARLEVHPISSITLTDSEFLAGKKTGRQVMLAGQLRIPKPGNDKLPAVVMLHGSGGMGGVGAMIEEWSRELNQLGIATFALDSFSGRGITSTVADQSQLGRLNMVADAYRALEVLAKHPRIDANRIAVMGFSRGGQSALYAAMNRLYATLGPANNLRFAAHIAFYPDCSTSYRADTEVGDKPIRVLHGIADDYNPIAPCRAYVERLKKAQKDVELIAYADAYHVFDAPFYQPLAKIPTAQTTRHCKLEEADDSQIINRETLKTFNFADPCVEKGTTIAFNEAASSKAREFVRGFLTDTFKLK